MSDIQVTSKEIGSRRCCDGLCGALDCYSCHGQSAIDHIWNEKAEALRQTCEHCEVLDGVCSECGAKIAEDNTLDNSKDCACGCRPGITFDRITVRQLEDGSWEAVAPIGSIFGAEVQGECRGAGATEDAARAALKKEQSELYESIWL